MISWEVLSRTRVVGRRVTHKLVCFVDSVTFGDPSTVGTTWSLRLRNRFISENHIQITLRVLHRSWRSWRRERHIPSNDGPLKIVRTREEVEMELVRVVVSAGLPMSFFDNKEVRKVVHMTTECTQNYIRTEPDGVKATTIHKFIDDTNMGKMREMSQDDTPSATFLKLQYEDTEGIRIFFIYLPP